MILNMVGIKELFDAVADGNIVSKAKPDPEVFTKAANMIGIEPEIALYLKTQLQVCRLHLMQE